MVRSGRLRGMRNFWQGPPFPTPSSLPRARRFFKGDYFSLELPWRA